MPFSRLCTTLLKEKKSESAVAVDRQSGTYLCQALERACHPETVFVGAQDGRVGQRAADGLKLDVSSYVLHGKVSLV